MRTRCIRSGRGDISVKRSRGTSSEFHSDRMRTGAFPSDTRRLGETIKVQRRASRTCLVSRARAKNFLKNISISREFEILDSLTMYNESL